MKKIVLVQVMLLSALFISCQNDDQNSPNSITDDAFAENFGAEVSRDFIGEVIDINGNPIQNATVTIGSESLQTDVNGVFVANNVSVFQQFAYIRVSKAGFVEGSRALVPTAGTNSVRIMLIPSAPVQTINSGGTSEVALDSGTKVIFDGDFEDESGANYTGSVAVSIYHLQKSNENLDALMPGMLYGKTETGSEAVLKTFGMLNVELRGSSGQKLQIKDGHTAEIEMMIDDSQIGTAPSTIPLWHFDSQRGYWKQQGVATKSGNKYVGEVTHFSWWNCDDFSSVTNLTVTIVDDQGNPVPNVGVSLVVGDFSSVSLPTNAEGQVSGVVPAGQTLTISVTDICGNILHNSTIGPFSADTSIEISAESSTAVAANVRGTLMNCDGGLIQSGYVVMRMGTKTIFSPVSNGTFNIETFVCDTESDISIGGFDIVNYQASNNYTFTIGAGETNIGSMHACEAITEFMWYQIDDLPVNYIFDDITMEANPNPQGLFTLKGMPANGPNGMYLIINSITDVPGTYHASELGFWCSQFYPQTGFTAPYNYTFYPGSTVMDARLLRYGEVGEYIDIAFTVTKPTGAGTETATLRGFAHVLREF